VKSLKSILNLQLQIFNLKFEMLLIHLMEYND